MFKTPEELTQLVIEGRPSVIDEIPVDFMGPNTDALLAALDTTAYNVYSCVVETIATYELGSWTTFLYDVMYRSHEGLLDDQDEYDSAVAGIVTEILLRADSYALHFAQVAELLGGEPHELGIEIYDEMSFESRSIVWYHVFAD